jgi:phosphatase NudJ
MPSNSLRFSPAVTLAAIVEREGRFLLVEERTPEGLRLNNPAGHLEQGETPLAGVMRECLEETACHFTPQALVGIYMARFQRPARGDTPAQDVTYLRLAYTGPVSAPEPGRALDEPIERTLWLTPSEMRAQSARMRSPLVLQCMEDYLAGKRLPLDVLTVDGSLLQPRQLP